MLSDIAMSIGRSIKMELAFTTHLPGTSIMSLATKRSLLRTEAVIYVVDVISTAAAKTGAQQQAQWRVALIPMYASAYAGGGAERDRSALIV